ncbi:MAG: bifunctional pyr operon transcriptional regulator/uracil phosphoribosyltransferase PyrR [Saprospiraceae bacterium]|nr:bifunctional pyr operon transcriptional regulator/uracil phosphoribosyltransferase PyrR [Bacteroidia bacterium]NNE13913.1 bifunctional pyr operon transcriptional regulator/uracil phosphoribosyltransferase PyrR [Saprospiraceae bacterium]NNL91288.1 bifunctional pyr operon transcriptional regulator/uracil phosphoribosyltransferase PyrR [Saprospiraceae bacterium]
MHKGRQILSPQHFNITLLRLAHQIIENYPSNEIIYIVGIQEKGVILAERLIEIIKDKLKSPKIVFGKLDITFYRDDFRIREKPIVANSTQIDFDVEGKKILLVDDVLYSGRTIHAAMAALQDLGRVGQIELLTMVDRRFNRHLPIKSDYTGIQVDSLDEAYVKVQWKHLDGEDKVLIFSANNKNKN